MIKTAKLSSSILAASCLMLFSSEGMSQTPPENEALPVQMADACYSLDTNEAWRELFEKFTTAYSAGKYDEALEYTHQLEAICSRSPVLNYSIATTHFQKGDKQLALSYIHAATDNSKEFNIEDEILEKIWFTRYELENEDKFCDKAAYEKQIADQKALTASTGEAIKNNLVDAEHDRAATIMWTGTGVGIFGIVSLAAGAALASQGIKGNTEFNRDELFSNDSVSQMVNDIKKDITIKNKDEVYAGYALIGVGVAATVAGAIMAGIGGYNYTHQITDEAVLSFDVSPQYLGLDLKF